MKRSESIQVAVMISVVALFIIAVVGYRYFAAQNITVFNVTSQNIIVAEKYVANKVNINTASVDELIAIDGIGEIKAQRIIDYRTTNGFFTSIYDLTNVDGFSEATIKKIKPYITV